MTRDSQRTLERHWIDSFLRQYGPTEASEAVALAPPEPDFRASIPEGQVGIEITEFYPNPKIRAIESEQDGIVERARQLYLEREFPNVRVYVNWADGAQTSKRDRPIATWLSNTVANHVPGPGEHIVLDDDEHELGHPAFERIDISRELVYVDTHWTSPRHWWGSTATLETIQAEVTRKSDRPRGYKGHYLERWLVIVHHGFQPSSGFDLPEEITEHEFESSFEKVFVFGLTPTKIIPLRVRPLASV